jgi:hypothetical protein
VESGEQRIRDYIAALAGDDWQDAWHALSEEGPAALPFIEDAFRRERSSERRTCLVEAVHEIRQTSSIPFLSEALHDPAPEVWKTVLDALVGLACPESEPVLEQALERAFERDKDRITYGEWVQEALEQLRESR